MTHPLLTRGTRAGLHLPVRNERPGTFTRRTGLARSAVSSVDLPAVSSNSIWPVVDGWSPRSDGVSHPAQVGGSTLLRRERLGHRDGDLAVVVGGVETASGVVVGEDVETELGDALS